MNQNIFSGLKQELVRAVIMVVAVSLLAVGFSLVRKNSISPFQEYSSPDEVLKLDSRTIISVEEAYNIWETEDVIFIDTREYSNYIEGHISGAFPLPYTNMEQFFQKLLPLLDPSFRIITYCDGKDCLSSLHVADFLQQNGYSRVNIFFGGWELWNIKNLPSEKGEMEIFK